MLQSIIIIKRETENGLFFLYKKTAMTNAIAEKCITHFLFCVVKVYGKIKHATV